MSDSPPPLADGLTYAGQGFFDIEYRGEAWTVYELKHMASTAEDFMTWMKLTEDHPW